MALLKCFGLWFCFMVVYIARCAFATTAVEQTRSKKSVYATCDCVDVGTFRLFLYQHKRVFNPRRDCCPYSRSPSLLSPTPCCAALPVAALQGFTDGFGASRSGAGRSSASSSSGGYGSYGGYAGYSSGRKAAQPEDDYSFVSGCCRNGLKRD